eukprot:CAMPEP_0197485654 /NCGR_PEP_ID=MMETSP1311-20131121/581_1 /TAXON_ID=464262 /ORGANISM="Genus nov. species nov., Strain RCC856" /LENGTH=121 /DNA_ID=CAMNT_0043028373 /DNA_START=195 /DNA_END=560 /DNA_ORIENTATION=+
MSVLVKEEEKEAQKKLRANTMVQPDDCIDFAQLHRREGKSLMEMEIEDDLMKASHGIKGRDGESSRVVQLTGFSDPIYAEAVMLVHQYVDFIPLKSSLVITISLFLSLSLSITIIHRKPKN